MAEKVFMLALSPTMEAGTILKWNKREGDSISHNEVICEVETDKASMEYESLNEGTILKIVVEEGGSAVVGHTIAIVGKEGDDISPILAEIENESSNVPSGPESTGAEEHASGPAVVATTAPHQTDSTVVPIVGQGGRVKASPLARKLAAEKGIVIETIKGTGPDGRIVKRDIESAKNIPAGQFGGAVAAVINQDVSIPVKGVRAVIAQRLSESKFSAPHFYVKNTIRTESMMSLRAEMNAGLSEKLSLNAFIMKFAAESIKQHPEINSSWQEDKIVQYASIDIGLAVDLGNGLFTPIVRNCGNKGIKTIDAELKILIEKVRDRTITAEEYTGATFSISNLGSFGVDEFTAIINPPGAAILAIGRGRKVPVVNNNGSVEVGDVMTVSLSCDHRVIDGSLAGRFVSKLQSIIENPGVALL